MANRFLQLKRNAEIFENLAAAKAKFSDATFLADKLDGELVVARYLIDPESGAVENNVGILEGHIFSSGTTKFAMILDSENGNDIEKIKDYIGQDEHEPLSANTEGHEYISASTSVTDALNTLNDALVSTKISAATWNGVSGVVSNNVITFSGLTGSNAKVSSAYTQVDYPEEFAEKVADYKVADTDTISDAFNKVETTISALTQEVINNEEVVEKAVEKLVEAAGFSADPISYVISQSCPTISASTNIKDALEKLDTELNSRQKFTSVEMPLKVESDVLKLKLSETKLDTRATEKGLDADPLGANILKKDETSGELYALADLHYDSATNKLTFENSLGINEIKLTGVNFIEKAEYHKADEELVIYYTKPGETSASTVTIDLTDLVEEFDGQSRNTSETVTVKTDAEIKAEHNVSVYIEHDKANKSKVYADIDIFDCGTY